MNEHAPSGERHRELSYRVSRGEARLLLLPQPWIERRRRRCAIDDGAPASLAGSWDEEQTRAWSLREDGGSAELSRSVPIGGPQDKSKRPQSPPLACAWNRSRP